MLRIKSGNTVQIETLITNSPKRLEDAGLPAEQVEQSLRDITDQVKDKGPGGHILTGRLLLRRLTRRRARSKNSWDKTGD